MGIKHLEAIEDHFRSNKSEYFTTGYFNGIFGFEFYTVKECLNYLLKKGDITMKIKGSYTRYKWVK